MTMKNIRFDFSYTGMLYAIFTNTDDAWAYAEEHGGYIGCWNGYENAVSCFETLGL